MTFKFVRSDPGPLYDANMAVVSANRLSQWSMAYGLKPCAIAVCFVLVALLWTFPLQHIIAYPFVFLFFGAIMGSAWFGGAIAGFLAVVQSSFLITYFFIPPLFSIGVAKESQSFLAAFILCAIAISIVSSARKRAENAIRNARDELEAKVQERTAELNQSNLEIRESERQLRLLTEAIPQQIWRANASGVIEYCNQHLTDYVGRDHAELIGESFFSILHPEDEPLFRQGWETALAAGNQFEMETRVHRRSEERNLGRDGGYRWFLVRAIPQRTSDGRIAHWYGTHIDIEEQHRVQENLMDAQENLAHLSRTLSMAEMAASIAHELNQPLTAVVTHAYACHEWLHGAPANVEKAAATADKIVQESTRASAVLKRVRALFQKEEQVREAADLNGIIHALAWLLREEAIRRGVSIHLDLARDLPRPEVDSVQIQQVLLNLANNAMEVMAQSPGAHELTFRSEMRDEKEIMISVKDSGPGIDPEFLSKIFEPFFSTKLHGTGMGLAICRSIVEAHGGRLWASNVDSGGAVFKFTVRMRS